MKTADRDFAEYVENMSFDLGRMANTRGMQFLAYLLQMAGQEASDIHTKGIASETFAATKHCEVSVDQKSAA